MRISLPGAAGRGVARRVLIVALSFLMLWPLLPLPILYVLVYLTACESLLSRHTEKRETFFVINIRFLLFTGIHMIVLGVIALLSGLGVREILKSVLFRGISVSAALLVNGLLDFVIAGAIDRNRGYKADYGRDEFRLLAAATWFWVIFALLDSLPTMFQLPDALVSLFLIGSNTLMLMTAAFFNFHVYMILQNAYLEEEHIRLMREEELQRSRLAEIEAKVYTDPLTGVYGRTYIMDRLSSMMAEGAPFSLVYIDLDSLKSINDELGHRSGDEHLKSFAGSLGRRLGFNDILARIGGDEFVIAMPDCPEGEAKRRMEAIRDEIGRGEERKMPFSFGVTYVPAHSDKSISDYLEEADQLMYEDKKSVRR